MKYTMKKNMTALAMSVAVATGAMGYMATAQAGGTAEYTNTITISSEDTCEITVTPPSQTDATFNAKWTGTTTSGVTTGVLENDGTAATPAIIQLAMSGGTKCNLSTIHLKTTAPASIKAGTGSKALIHEMDTNTGVYWRFVPLLASVSLYEKADATGTPVTEVKFNDPDNNPHQMNAAAQGTQGEAITDMDGVPGMLMTDNNFGKGIESALITHASGDSSIVADDATVTYQAAKLGIGVALGKDPETLGGQPDAKAVVNADEVTIPFTVTVTAS